MKYGVSYRKSYLPITLVVQVEQSVGCVCVCVFLSVCLSVQAITIDPDDR